MTTSYLIFGFLYCCLLVLVLVVVVSIYLNGFTSIYFIRGATPSL